ncbi:hypothetical protein MP228_006452 [Amoeboaphelidium protococcarum]|nr:hypothetical protein MP228_006452 [Amoeboaphelidium protococcarum]
MTLQKKGLGDLQVLPQQKQETSVEKSSNYQQNDNALAQTSRDQLPAQQQQQQQFKATVDEVVNSVKQEQKGGNIVRKYLYAILIVMFAVNCVKYVKQNYCAVGNPNPICQNIQSARISLKQFISLSYPVPYTITDQSYNHSLVDQGVLFQKGPYDILFVLGWIAIMTVIQKTLTLGLYTFAFHRVKVASSDASPQKATSVMQNELLKAQVSVRSAMASRFAEQSYLFIYYVCSLSMGLYIWSREKYYPFNLRECWTDYPVYQLPSLIKWYYLVQASFWLQQLSQFLFFTERHERRKDHWAMTAHHGITSMLVLSSYLFHFTRIGNVVLIVMDAADVFLCAAKSLKYLLDKKYQFICDILFGLFTIVWLVTRHILYYFIVRSIYVDAVDILKNVEWNPYMVRAMFAIDQQSSSSSKIDHSKPGAYFSVGTWIFFLTLFVLLQSLLIYWFLLIVKVVTKVIKGTGAEDVREDEEDD